MFLKRTLCAMTLVSSFGMAATSSAATASFQQGTSGYTSGSDTEINRSTGKTENNYGAQDVFFIQGPDTDPIHQAFVKFDDIFGVGIGQVPTGQTITSATLSIYYYATLGGVNVDNRSIDVHGMLIDIPNYGTKDDSAASVGEVTWGSREQAVSQWGTLGTTAGPVSGEDFSSTLAGSVNFNPVDDDDSFLEIDITGLVQDWYDGTLPNYGVVLRPGNSNTAEAFRANETGTIAERPILTINYEPIPEPATLGLLTLGAICLLSSRKRS